MLLQFVCWQPTERACSSSYVLTSIDPAPPVFTSLRHYDMGNDAGKGKGKGAGGSVPDTGSDAGEGSGDSDTRTRDIIAAMNAFVDADEVRA